MKELKKLNFIFDLNKKKKINPLLPGLLIYELFIGFWNEILTRIGNNKNYVC